MSDTKEWGYFYHKEEGFSIDPYPSEEKFDLDVDCDDTYYGASLVTLDALEVYKALKYYFKGTEYE